LHYIVHFISDSPNTTIQNHTEQTGWGGMKMTQPP
jgi:hypothetical protein